MDIPVESTIRIEISEHRVFVRVYAGPTFKTQVAFENMDPSIPPVIVEAIAMLRMIKPKQSIDGLGQNLSSGGCEIYWIDSNTPFRKKHQLKEQENAQQ